MFIWIARLVHKPRVFNEASSIFFRSTVLPAFWVDNMEQSNLHDKLFSRGSVTPPREPPTHLDSLFQSITTHGNSAPATPSMIADDDTSAPAASTTPADRQSALLSLLYPAATSIPAIRPLQQSPPASSIRSGQSPSNNSETQGKILLEQLMG